MEDPVDIALEYMVGEFGSKFSPKQRMARIKSFHGKSLEVQEEKESEARELYKAFVESTADESKPHNKLVGELVRALVSSRPDNPSRFALAWLEDKDPTFCKEEPEGA